jgi:hypothetical protein
VKDTSWLICLKCGMGYAPGFERMKSGSECGDLSANIAGASCTGRVIDNRVYIQLGEELGVSQRDYNSVESFSLLAFCEVKTPRHKPLKNNGGR